MIIKNRGFTLIETLFYIVGLVILLFVISAALIYMYDWYKATTIPAKVDQASITLIDKIVKEIHTSSTINLGYSTFNSSNGALSITGTNNGVTTTRRYALQSGCITYESQNNMIVCISPKNMTITRLYFTNVTSPVSSAVKFDIDIAYKIKQATTTKTYSGFAILKQSYE